LLALIHDGVLQPVSDGLVELHPVPLLMMMPIPRTPTIVHRESVTRIASDPSLVPAIPCREIPFDNGCMPQLAATQVARPVCFRRKSPEQFN